jgi:hypothetical protein
VKASNVENKIVDEANERTYIIMAPRLLTDGEMFRIIRREILKRGGRPRPEVRRSFSTRRRQSSACLSRLRSARPLLGLLYRVGAAKLSHD